MKQPCPCSIPRIRQPAANGGGKIAENDFLGIYRIFIRLLSIPYFVKQTAKLWNTFHKKGNAQAEEIKGRQEALFWVEAYPDLPETYREILSGYLLRCVELAGGQNVRVLAEGENPQRWQWRIYWHA
ncbi:hypothetical protein JW933_11460 [candidate division FCPU426 bacterium]|nr:hypothetical protein [candidate division FCPU426 bacterium]